MSTSLSALCDISGILPNRLSFAQKPPSLGSSDGPPGHRRSPGACDRNYLSRDMGAEERRVLSVPNSHDLVLKGVTALRVLAPES